MANLYKVAILGNHSGTHEECITVFDLNVHQICSLLEKPDINQGINHAKLGAQPSVTYAPLGGGRFFPSASRERIARVMQGVEIFIAMLPASPSRYNFMSIELAEENLSDQCSTVIARIVDNSRSTGTTRRWFQSLTVNDVTSTLKLYRLDSEKFEDKLRSGVIADPSVKVDKTQKKQKKGDESEGVSWDLALLRAALLGEELRERVIQPVKETLSAGEILLGAGQRLSRWISSFVKTA